MLEYLIATGPVVVFRRTVEGVVTFVSPNVERLLGYAAEEVVDVPGFWDAHVHPHDRERFDAEARDAFAAGATELWRDYRFRCKDGTYRWLSARTHVDYDGAGDPEALRGYAFDVTEQHELEEQSAQLFRFPLALLFVAGLDGFFKRVSAGYERLLGWTEDELLSRPFTDFVHPDDVGALGASIEEFAAGRTEVIDQEVRIRCKDGTYRWLSGNYRPVLEEGLMYGVAVDVTERKRSEEALRESERRTHLILDTSYEAFISIDGEGRIIDWNTEASRIFGWSREEAVGRVLAETIVPERHRAAHVEGLERARTTGEGPILGRRIEIEGLRRDGEEFPVELTISPMRLDDSFVFNAFLRDVTERKQAEEAIRVARIEAERAREEAEVASRAKSDFLARMSHELRTPLNAILGFAQLLQIERLAPKHAESVEQIVRGGGHLLLLIEELLDVARIEQGRLTLSIEPVAVQEVVEEALVFVLPLAESADVPIRADVAGFEGYVLADRQRLMQVLMNLLTNAVKYNREGGDVIVSCGPTAAGRVRIAVTDTGPGIFEDMMDRLFLPFERLGAHRTSVEGTGIGLSISKHLTELMGGEIGAESLVGRGSTFWVDLVPAGAPEERHQVLEGVADVRAGSRQERTILYVEDNLSNLRLLERIVERRPLTKLVTATQGGLALDLAREHHPHLILLDVHLPDIEGDEVLLRLKDDPATRNIPVVLVSAEASPAKVERFLAAGARAYLTKPLDVARFLEVVDEILERPTP
jgi:PAS domain S-box-containing protein